MAAQSFFAARTVAPVAPARSSFDLRQTLPLSRELSIDDMHAALSRFFADVETLRQFVQGMQLAAQSQEHDHGTSAALYWPTIMQGLMRMIPETGKLEDQLSDAFDTLQSLSETGTAHAGNQAGPAARAKIAKRAALAGGSERG